MKIKSIFKKAQDVHFEHIIYLIFAAITLFFFAWLVISTENVSESKFLDTQCMASVQYAATLKKMSVGLFQNEIKCPTRELVVSQTKESLAKREMAEAMAACMKEFGNGDLDLFKNNGIYCHVCSTITFSPKQGTISNFTQYLNKEYLLNGNKTYSDYLLGYETPKAGEYAPAVDKIQFSELPRDKKYAVLFVYSKGQDDWKDLQKKLEGLSIGTGGSAVTGIIMMKVVGLGLIGTGVGTVAGVLVLGGWLVFMEKSDMFNTPPEYSSQVMFVPWTQELVDKVGCNYAK